MNNWDIGDSEEWIEDVEIENVIDSNEEQILNQQDLIEQIENSSESIKVDFFQEDDGEILSLTEYVNPESNNSLSVIAEYNNIDVINIDKKSQKTAQELVRKITNFIVNFDDVELTEEHQKYLKNVGDLELTTLKDLLTITEYNKQMINNIVFRINSVQAEDYAMIQAYTSLVNNHMRLMKDLQIKYKAIPGVIKRMKAEILCNQELGKDENDYKRLEQEVEQNIEISSNKDMIRELRRKREEELNKNK
jgi:hypothetical protein